MAQLYPMFATNVVVEQMQSNDEYKKEILPDLLKEFKKNPNQKAPWATDCNTWQTAASGKGLDHLNNGLQLAVEDYFNYIGCEPFKYEIRDRTWNNYNQNQTVDSNQNRLLKNLDETKKVYLNYDLEKIFSSKILVVTRLCMLNSRDKYELMESDDSRKDKAKFIKMQHEQLSNMFYHLQSLLKETLRQI